MRMVKDQSSTHSRCVVLNIGHYRTGSTTLAKAAEVLGYRTLREFPNLSQTLLRDILIDPVSAVKTWWEGSGKSSLLSLVRANDWIGDGWVSLLPFLDAQKFLNFIEFARNLEGIEIRVVATARDVDSLVRSELHHWVTHDLEKRAGLGDDERCNLEDCLRQRAKMHRQKVDLLAQQEVALHVLALEEFEHWPAKLAAFFEGTPFSTCDWKQALASAGRQNASRKLPLEGVLLTFRLGLHPPRSQVKCLLSTLRRDLLTRCIVVLALDADEASSAEAIHMLELIQRYCDRVCLIEISSRDFTAPFPICQVWDKMANTAFREGADWVVLLGDDIVINCPFHYRATYRAFLDISKRIGCPFGFGCPWWNDLTFPGFPTFPVVGRAHYEIFGSLIPAHRAASFVNQDLDPYLQRLYLKFGAAPVVNDVQLRNTSGGNGVSPARYRRVSAVGWKDWVIEDDGRLKRYLKGCGVDLGAVECVLVDVVVPTYRVDTRFLLRICSLEVPNRCRTTFIVVVDNPDKLKRTMHRDSIDDAAAVLEKLLTARSANNIRVRCNQTNGGASHSRNRGIDESSAEFILFLDDDVCPKVDLLSCYQEALMGLEENVVGLVGMVRFPRRHDLPVLHAAVLMSYLAFMFEIASNRVYANPKWGVTANLLVKRGEVRFDTVYAKTGGGEDVDFCLRTLAEQEGSCFMTVANAEAYHDFWPGGLIVLLRHFFCWAVGDGALFKRYPQYCYRSWPNIAESFAGFALLFCSLCPFHDMSWLALLSEAVVLFVSDCLVDMSQGEEFERRRQLLGSHQFSCAYYLAAHVLANLYVAVLECGRLCGHCRRGELRCNAARRFDWHCGILPRAPQSFRRRERTKFGWFLIASFVNALLLSPSFRRWISCNSDDGALHCGLFSNGGTTSGEL